MGPGGEKDDMDTHGEEKLTETVVTEEETATVKAIEQAHRGK